MLAAGRRRPCAPVIGRERVEVVAEQGDAVALHRRQHALPVKVVVAHADGSRVARLLQDAIASRVAAGAVDAAGVGCTLVQVVVVRQVVAKKRHHAACVGAIAQRAGGRVGACWRQFGNGFIERAAITAGRVAGVVAARRLQRVDGVGNRRCIRRQRLHAHMRIAARSAVRGRRIAESSREVASVILEGSGAKAHIQPIRRQRRHDVLRQPLCGGQREAHAGGRIEGEDDVACRLRRRRQRRQFILDNALSRRQRGNQAGWRQCSGSDSGGAQGVAAVGRRQRQQIASLRNLPAVACSHRGACQRGRELRHLLCHASGIGAGSEAKVAEREDHRCARQRCAGDRVAHPRPQHKRCADDAGRHAGVAHHRRVRRRRGGLPWLGLRRCGEDVRQHQQRRQQRRQAAAHKRDRWMVSVHRCSSPL